MVQADLETARADGQDLEAQLAAEVEAKSTLEKARAAAVQVRRPVTSLLLQLGHKPEPSRTALSMVDGQAPLAPAPPDTVRLF